ncbi:MAG: DUF6472 family protein [Eubacteriales bacterium]|nr:DUF6472 family protein [Eubacteriales bacterium]
MIPKSKSKKCDSNCDTCAYYDYNENTESYECHMNLDEDEMVKFLSDSFSNCPYYELYDEYKTVQKQN